MKNFIETFTTSVLLAVIIFAVVSLMTAQAELVKARETHSELLQAVQNSDPETLDDIYGLRTQLDNSVRANHKNWHVDVTKLESSTSRSFYQVTLEYTIDVPLFGTVVRGNIQGYAH